MRNIERIIGNYWIGYYGVYLVAVLVLLYRHNWTLAQWDDIELLSKVFSTAAGYALLAVVVVEGLGRMVLLIPKTVRSIFNKGRAEGLVEGRVEGLAEGLVEGRVEGRQEERKRMLAAHREARVRGIVPDSSEFEDFILNFEPDIIGEAR